MVTRIKLLSDGIIKTDAGTLFGAVPKTTWSSFASTDRLNRISLNNYCMLLYDSGKHILIDSGAGPSNDFPNPKVLKELRTIGVTLRDIDIVVLSSLHSDHSGGVAKLHRDGTLEPTFPRARYFIQQPAWDDISSPTERCFAMPNEECIKLISGQVELISGEVAISPSLTVIPTGGHAAGHQIAILTHGGEKIVYLGDLIPTHWHIALNTISALDRQPEETLEAKRWLLGEANRGGWMLTFPHGRDIVCAYLQMQREGMGIRPTTI